MNALIVGAGASGFLHALALRSAGVRVAHVYDPDRERATWLAELCGASVAPHLETNASVVAICSPPGFHVAQAEALARPGRITFVEKPVATTRDELTRLHALPGIVPIVQWRAGQSAHRLRAAFAAETFGPKPRITCELRLWRDRDYWNARASTDAWPGGAMLSIGIHAVDWLLWSVNRAAVVTALVDTRTRGEVGLAFEDGTTAHVRIALDVPDQNEFRLRVLGSRASAELLATEADPTAAPMRWLGEPPPAVTTGATGSPLLVPYLHEALSSAGPRLGVRDVEAAHAALVGGQTRLARSSIA